MGPGVWCNVLNLICNHRCESRDQFQVRGPEKMFLSAGCRCRPGSGGLRSRPSQLKGLAERKNIPGRVHTPKNVCVAALKNHHIEYHFTNCTRHVNTKGGFQPQRIRACVSERPPSCCALAACIPLLRHQRDRQIAGGGGVSQCLHSELPDETVRGKRSRGRREGAIRGELFCAR